MRILPQSDVRRKLRVSGLALALLLPVCIGRAQVTIDTIAAVVPVPVTPSGGSPAPTTLILERIEIQGARKTRPHVIHRYLSLRPGAELTPAAIAQDYARLTATNFFKRVEFSAQPGSAPGRIILVIEVVERYWPWLEFAGGFSELDGWYLVPLGIRVDNFFGRGNIGGGRLVIGDRTSGALLHYRQPQILGSDFDLLVETGGMGRDFIHYIEARRVLHRVEHGSLRLALAGTRGPGRFVSLGLRFDRWRPEQQARFTANDSRLTTFPSPLAQQLSETRSNSVFLRLQIDTRDRPFFPRAGIWGAVSFEMAAPEIRSDLRFNRYLFDGRWYKELGHNVLAVHGKAGWISPAAPFFERFYLGGAYSLRGFAERGLTPLGWGTGLLLGQAELRFPVTGPLRAPSLHAALFLDAGRLQAPGQNADFTTAAGFGFRLKLPVIGLLRCDFGYPLDRDDFRFHVSLGETF